jgi:hypothetical protein
MDTTTVHLSLDGVHVKTVPSRQTTVSLTRLRSAGARPAGPPPSRAVAISRTDHNQGGAARSVAVEVDQVVNVDVHEAEFHVYDQTGELITTLPRSSGKEVTRTKGYGVRDRVGQHQPSSAGFS